MQKNLEIMGISNSYRLKLYFEKGYIVWYILFCIFASINQMKPKIIWRISVN